MAFSESSAASKLTTPERIRRPRLGVLVLVESGMVVAERRSLKVRNGATQEREETVRKRNCAERGDGGKTECGKVVKMMRKKGDFGCQIGLDRFW